MREIKFRGWHIPKKTMFSAEEMASDQLTLLPTGSFINVSGDSTHLSQIMPQDKFIPLQFTGMRDKDGKEIYEGDVVELRQETSKGSEGLLTTIVEWSKDGLNFNIYPCHDEKYWKVIGNIYENPELVGESE